MIRWQPEEHYDRWIGEDRRRAMFETVDLHFMNEVVDRGGDFQKVIYDTADKYPEYKEEIRWWHDRWRKMATPKVDLSVATLRALKHRNVPVFALSNFGIGSFAASEKDHNFLSEFDRRYISGHMGMTKPSAEIYKRVEDDCKIDPTRLLFTDDRAENIDAAAVRGWQTHLFQGPRAWADLLIRTGLIEESDL